MQTSDLVWINLEDWFSCFMYSPYLLYHSELKSWKKCNSNWNRTDLPLKHAEWKIFFFQKYNKNNNLHYFVMSCPYVAGALEVYQ